MNLIPLLVLEYLFPASKLVLEGGSSQQDSSDARGNYWAKCTGKESRVAAYQLLVHLVTNSEKNMVALVEHLVSLHHSLNPDFLKEFQVWVNAFTGNTILYVDRCSLIICLHKSFSFCSKCDKPKKDVLFFTYLIVLSYEVYPMCLQYAPAVEGRCASGYVGLKNGGATCYMNSVLQQLYLVPGVAEDILAATHDVENEDR